MDNGDGYTTPSSHRTPPVRDDYWTEEATYTLVESWGERFMELNRGNLRQKHWKEVADDVNARHGHIRKNRCTDIQCKNRIDTLKKKYKIEKDRVSSPSTWCFFSRLDDLIGPSYKPSPSITLMGPRSKRTTHSQAGDPYLGWKFPEDDSTESSKSRTSGSASWQRRNEECSGYGELAEAIEKAGEIYETVEKERQRQTVELEKHRMKFAKDLEIQRMKLFMESQIQMEKVRQANRKDDKRAREEEEDDDGQGFLSSFFCFFNDSY